ncbi:THAP domain-containing protein 2 [Holothuria leucospilota]|uniref:THAP domain-containing protein 2 n=1 Tax=Holothuria leucospilota TaxID=206669 RepID=A0A9Q0Y9A4_HOLLE|nr:THAP domain-containing protein 2 [Holothuria leucospilota]
MPKSCVAVGCKNHNKMIQKVSFFTFPTRHRSPERRDKWLNAVKRQNVNGSRWSPSKHLVIGAEHFVTGKPNKDPCHPDYVPSIFNFGSKLQKHKSKRSLERYEALQKRRGQKQAIVPAGEEDISEVSDEPKDPSDNQTTDAVPMLQRLTDDNISLREEVNNLRQKLENNACFGTPIIENNDTKSKFFTGLSWEVFTKTFEFLYQFIVKDKTTGEASKISLMNQFFITLVRVRQDLSFLLIAHLSGCSESLIHLYFWKWIDIMVAKLAFLIRRPDPGALSQSLPNSFRASFPKLTCIIDCFEVFIEQPKHLKARAQTYSQYKRHNTFKVLIACTPLGAVSFLSSAWGGRVSDVELVRKSGFLSSRLHDPGDQILADRGFTMQDDFALQCSVELIIPAFTKGKTQLSAKEVEQSRKMASVRIHVERVIGLLKNRFKILQGTLPVHMIQSISDYQSKSEKSSVDRILTVCASLLNLGDCIVFKKDPKETC